VFLVQHGVFASFSNVAGFLSHSRTAQKPVFFGIVGRIGSCCAALLRAIRKQLIVIYVGSKKVVRRFALKSQCL